MRAGAGAGSEQGMRNHAVLLVSKRITIAIMSRQWRPAARALEMQPSIAICRRRRPAPPGDASGHISAV